MTSTDPRPVTIPATDGFALGASVFEPDAEPPRRVALIAPATGVKRKLYRSFAEYLTGAGLTVVTWDWRGTGDSRPESLRGFEATMREWGEKDLAGVIGWARERWPGVELVGVGHSFGGQSFGLTPESRALDRLAFLMAQIGYHGHWPAPARWGHVLLWRVLVPVTTAVLGYFPAKRLRFGEDLPKGVAREWARWCMRPEYLGDFSGHASLEVPILSVSFDDDPIASPRAVEALLTEYRGATVTRRPLTATDVDRERVGHLGFFRLGPCDLWAEVRDFLAAD